MLKLKQKKILQLRHEIDNSHEIVWILKKENWTCFKYENLVSLLLMFLK